MITLAKSAIAVVANRNAIAAEKCQPWSAAVNNDLPKRWANIGPRIAVTPNVKKLIPPVALPLTLSGLASLIIE